MTADPIPLLRRCTLCLAWHTHPATYNSHCTICTQAPLLAIPAGDFDPAIFAEATCCHQCGLIRIISPKTTDPCPCGSKEPLLGLPKEVREWLTEVRSENASKPPSTDSKPDTEAPS